MCKSFFENLQCCKTEYTSLFIHLALWYFVIKWSDVVQKFVSLPGIVSVKGFSTNSASIGFFSSMDQQMFAHICMVVKWFGTDWTRPIPLFPTVGHADQCCPCWSLTMPPLLVITEFYSEIWTENRPFMVHPIDFRERQKYVKTKYS